MANPELFYTLTKVAFHRKLADMFSGPITGAPMQQTQVMQQGMMRQAENQLQQGVQKFQQGAQKASQKAQEMASRITGNQQGPPQPDQDFQQMAGGMGYPMGGSSSGVSDGGMA